MALSGLIETVENVYSCAPANNGAGPLWCHGNTTIVRIGDQVFATGLETLPDAKPLNNCRWTLWRRGDHDPGWTKCYTDPERTREPAPLTVVPDGRLFVSANPARTPLDAYSGPAEPEILEFDPRRPSFPPIRRLPRWTGEPCFTEHSYRSFATDSRQGGMLLLQNVGYKSAFWSYWDATGANSATGELVWPWGADYAQPQPVRICYPNVSIADRAVRIFGVSDIEEPNAAFRDFKFQLTGNKWDYDFRRLFFAETPDITQEPFRPWMELASREATCGWLTPCDLNVGADGVVRLMWYDRSCDVRLREKFFPHEILTRSLEYALLRNGRLVHRSRLAVHTEGGTGPIPRFARFHPAPDGRFWAVAVFQEDPHDAGRLSNRLIEIRDDGSTGKTIPLEFAHPFGDYFFTATPRAGTQPAEVIDLFGIGAGQPGILQYARIRIPGDTSS